MGGWDAPWHWVIIAILVIALFGYKKLPDAARSVGRSLRIFKTEIKGMGEDDKARAKAGEQAEQKALPPAEFVKRDAQPEQSHETAAPRPRPRPTPNGQSRTTAHSD